MVALLVSLSHTLFCFAFARYSVVPTITPLILLGAVVGIGAKLVYDGYGGDGFEQAVDFAYLPFTALGVAISLFLGFHNNASYSRWWEARTIWGTHIIDLRNLIRFLLSLNDSSVDTTTVSQTSVCQGEEEQHMTILSNNHPPTPTRQDWRHEIILLAMAHAHATRHQLRRGEPCPFDKGISALHDRNRFLTTTQAKLADASHNPANCILQMAADIVGQQQRHHLDPYTRVHLIKLIDRLCVAQTACERIENTSLPFAYSLLVHRTSFFFVILSPWAMVGEMGWWTPVFTAIVAYTFFGLDELARQLQEPFRVDEPNALALSAMCRTMEMDVCEAVPGREVPPKLVAGPDLVLM